jgi:hypothetical protein
MFSQSWPTLREWEARGRGGRKLIFVNVVSIQAARWNEQINAAGERKRYRERG